MKYTRLVLYVVLCLIFSDRLWSATVRMLVTGDMHGRMEPKISSGYTYGGAAEMLAYWQQIEGYQPQNFLVVGCGDSVDAKTDCNVLAYHFNGFPVIDVMNFMGYDLSAIGNHEWDYGGDALHAMAQRATFPFVASNLVNADGTPVSSIAPYLLYEEQGVKVGIIGLGYKSTIDGVKGNDNVTTIRTTYALLHSLGAQVIILMAHLSEITLADLIPKVADLHIPLVLGGHSHSLLTLPVGDTLIVNSGSGWGDYSRIDLDYNPDTGQTTILSCKQVSPKQLNPPISYALKDLIEAWRELVYQTYKVDNADFGDVTILGNWLNYNAYPGFYNMDYLDDSNGYKGSDSVRFDVRVGVDDNYDLFLRWPAEMTQAAASVPVDIIGADGTGTTVMVNEQLNGGQWRKLGTYHFAPGAPGSVTVRNIDTTGVVTADAVRLLKANHAPVAADSTITRITGISPIPGTLIVSDPDGFPLQYKIVDEPTSGSVVIPDQYAARFVYTPQPSFTGSVNFTFQANDGVVFSNTATVTINIVNPAYTLMISGSPAPFQEYQPITFTAVPSDGSQAEFRYQIGWRLNSSSITWEPLTEYTTDSYSWTPPQGGDGYRLQVFARHIGSQDEFETSGTYDFRVNDAELTGLAVNVSDNPKELTPVIFTASPQGTAPSVEYLFQVGSGSAPTAWTPLTPYTTTPSCTWTPSAGGIFTVRVYAREIECPFDYQAVTTRTFTVQAVELTGVSLAISAPRSEGTPMTFTASPAGMTTGVEYLFKIAYVTESGAYVWVVTTPYSTASSYTWTPPDGGCYYARVYARKIGSGSYVNTPTTAFEVADLELTGVTIAISSTRKVGTPITFTATATGTAPHIEYQFWIDPPDTSWTALGPYSDTPGITWTPTSTGTHYIRVYVREAGNSSGYQLSYKVSFKVL